MAELKIAADNKLDSESYVIPGKDGKSPRYKLREAFESAFETIGRPDCTFHCLRKSFATHYITEHPNEIYNLMKICGWQDLKTAEMYIGASKKLRKQRLRKVNELGRKNIKLVS